MENGCHSKLDISGHLIKRYIPLLYLNPVGLLMYNARTFPVYTTACIFQTLLHKLLQILQMENYLKDKDLPYLHSLCTCDHI